MGYMGMQMHALTSKGRKAAGCNSWQHVILHPKVAGMRWVPHTKPRTTLPVLSWTKQRTRLGPSSGESAEPQCYPRVALTPTRLSAESGQSDAGDQLPSSKQTSKPTPTTYCLHHSQTTSTMRWALTYIYGAQLPQHHNTPQCSDSETRAPSTHPLVLCPSRSRRLRHSRCFFDQGTPHNNDT